MFCEECGTKNKKNATFCENCGHKFETTNETVVNASPAKTKKPMDKKQKIIIGIVVAVVAILIGAYMYIGSLFTPEKVALKYFKAYTSNDADALYSTLNLEESKFVSKDLLKKGLKDKEKIKVANYSIEKEDKKEDSLSKSVTIKYVVDGSSNEKTKTIKLTKNKKKKLLFFDNWTVDTSEVVAKKYTISVPKNSEVKINDISVSDKYKQESYSSYYDSYEIPEILYGKYDLTVEYKSGIKLAGTLNVDGNYGSYRASSLKLESKTEKELIKQIREKVELLYKSAIEDKSFDDIKDSFNEDYRSDIEYRYNNLKNNAISEYNKLKEIKISDIKVTSTSVNEEKINLILSMKYDYKVEYKSGDETKEYTGKDKVDTFYVDFKLDKKDYIMTDLTSLVTYFSYYRY